MKPDPDLDNPNVELGESDRKELERLEEALWRDGTRFDRAYMERIIAPDFFEFGRSGRVYQRIDTLNVAPEPIQARLPLRNFRVRLLSRDVAQVTYDSAVKYDGAYQFGRRSSIWTRTSSGWLLRFHQGTPYDDDI